MKPYYEDAWSTIYHGDCREVLPAIDPVDLVFADPPYGVGYEYGDAYTDEGGAGYRSWMARLAADLRGKAEVVMVTPGISNLWTWPVADWVLSWHKPGSPRRSRLAQPARPQGGFNEWEPVLVYGPARFMHDTIRLPGVPQGPEVGDHPCPKPLRLLHWLIEGGSKPGDVVLDPFLGSGTTLRAAKDLNRRAIGIEVEERYCEIAAKRLSQEVLDFGGVA